MSSVPVKEQVSAPSRTPAYTQHNGVVTQPIR
jgi:hypothetical protein